MQPFPVYKVEKYVRPIAIIAISSFFLTSALASKQDSTSPGRQAQPEAASRTAVAPDIKPSALWDGRKEVEFHASNFPKMVQAADARFLIEDEYVLGITENGASRAYPTRFISWHHIINDKIGKKETGEPAFVTITYCIVCNSGIRFDTPQINGKPLQFDFYGLYNGVMTLYDRQTESVWLQVSGRAVKGPLLGTTLKRGPLLNTTWGQWKKLHPDTLVMAPDARFNDDYEPKGTIMARGYEEFPADYFSPTVTHRDRRLGMFESVLAVSMPAAEPVQPDEPTRAQHRAYPMKAFKGKTGVVNDRVGTAPVAVFFLADSETMNAVSPVVDGQTLTLEARKTSHGKTVFYDKETRTRWNIEGRAVDGPLAGRQLRRLDNHMSQWYGWVSYFPHTSIYGQSKKIAKNAARKTTF